MTSKELDERITSEAEQIYWMKRSMDLDIDEEADIRKLVKQLIRDCIEAVTPERSENDDGNDEFYKAVYNAAIDTIEANTKELLV